MPDWLKLQDETVPQLWGTAFRILNHYDDARDCVQDSILEALESAKVNSIENWPGFLRWLVVRRAIDLLRRRRSSIELTEFDLIQVDCNDAELAETVAMIRSELKNLPGDQAFAFWMFAVEEASGREIAQTIGVSENAVRLLVHRARKHLKSKLAPYHQP